MYMLSECQDVASFSRISHASMVFLLLHAVVSVYCISSMVSLLVIFFRKSGKTPTRFMPSCSCPNFVSIPLSCYMLLPIPPYHPYSTKALVFLSFPGQCPLQQYTVSLISSYHCHCEKSLTKALRREGKLPNARFYKHLQRKLKTWSKQSASISTKEIVVCCAPCVAPCPITGPICPMVCCQSLKYQTCHWDLGGPQVKESLGRVPSPMLSRGFLISSLCECFSYKDFCALINLELSH